MSEQQPETTPEFVDPEHNPATPTPDAPVTDDPAAGDDRIPDGEGP